MWKKLEILQEKVNEGLVSLMLMAGKGVVIRQYFGVGTWYFLKEE